MATTVQMNVRMLPEELERVRSYANSMGVSYSDWVRRRVLEPPPPRTVWAYIQDWADEIDKPYHYVAQRLLCLVTGNCKGLYDGPERRRVPLQRQKTHYRAFTDAADKARNRKRGEG